MKFRAKMVEANCMRLFSGVITMLSKLSRNCLLRICEDKLYFIISDEETALKKTMAWCILHSSSFFSEYNMAGDPEKNEICLEFTPDMLVASLSSLKAATEVAKSMKIKLTDKVSPCLTLEIDLPSQMPHSRTCVHDIPVCVLSRGEWSDLGEPPPYDYDISIEMPNSKVMRNVVDHLKKLSPFVTIIVSSNGVLTLKVKTTTVTVATHFNNLHLHKPQGVQDKVASCQVDVKRLANFLACDLISPNNVVCNVLSDKVVHQYFEQNGVILNFYLLGIDD